MAELGISIAANLIEVLGTEVIKEICDMWGYKSHLEDLNKTVTTIKNVLLDADSKREELSNVQRGYIRELMEVVYDADDLFDEFFTLAELKLIDGKKEGKFFYKVLRFFSSSKDEVGLAYRMSRKVKHIKAQLSAIAENHTNFGFSVDYKPIIRRREDTCSYVNAKEIFGREHDKDNIIDMLLGCTEEFCFLPIVGVGGLGKTTLAQLVYNDEKIKKEFPDQVYRLWVCVSDQEGVRFDVKTILCKILELLDTKYKYDSTSPLEMVQNQFQKEMRGKKYLLVLDDVWNEDRKKWINLKSFLMVGRGGTKIVVTTRSKMTTQIIGEKHAYELDGLSPENSWRLFEMSAFDVGQRQKNHQELIEIGRKIVEKCHGNPLAISVVGSLLFGQDVSKWLSVENSGLGGIENGDNGIMPILKLSYYNLEPSMKSCFSYCALFPKDFKIEKQMLISLWIAQGYIVPFDRGQSIEDAAQEHFLILFRRCFFENEVVTSHNDVEPVKVHDLMHDVAQKVREEEFRTVTSPTENLGDKVRHLRYVGNRCPSSSSLCSNKIRSLIFAPHEEPWLGMKIGNWKYLRALDLSCLDIRILPDSIDKLLLLRYLNLSYNHFKVLSEEITKLHNLETLLLLDCKHLTNLPKNFSKLSKLRHFDLRGCFNLTCMPLGMEKLTSLSLLPYFVVGRQNLTETKCDDEFKMLKSLSKIRGDMEISIANCYKRVEGMNDTGGYLKSMKHLKSVTFSFFVFKDRCLNSEAALETLEPHPNLERLQLGGYCGTTIPRWGRAQDNWAISFPHLVSISLLGCSSLLEIPVLSKLPHLESLTLCHLDKLEYMESFSSNTCRDTQAELATFFPSLKVLETSHLIKLKGWWKEELSGDDDDDHCSNWRLRFSSLSQLVINECQSLTSFPSCPSLEVLRLSKNNEMLQIMVKSIGEEEVEEDDNTAGNCSEDEEVHLWNLEIDNLCVFKSLPTNCLTRLSVSGHGVSLSETEETDSRLSAAFEKCSSSLKSLHIHNMNNLRRISGGKGCQSFTALESLELDNNKNEYEDDEILRKSFPENLQSLVFKSFKIMTSLPKGVRFLTSLKTLELHSCSGVEALPEWIDCLSSLQSLTIRYCDALKSLPEAMRNLTSLKRLVVKGCYELKQRCQKPNGEDWPKIQHIANIDI